MSLCLLPKRLLLQEMISDFCVYWDAYHPSKPLQISPLLEAALSLVREVSSSPSPVCVRGLTSCQAADLKAEPIARRPIASKAFFLYDPRLTYISQILGLEFWVILSK